MDPTRPWRKGKFDYVYVGLGSLVVLGLLIWAVFG
jgi:hypothetical protein